MARMRTINEALALIKEYALDSAVTYNMIRRLVKENATKYFFREKIILDFDDLLKYINQ